VFRNYLAAALRHLARHKFYGLINIAGLAAGFAAATYILLFVSGELGYDRFLPDYERTYLVTEVLHIPGHSTTTTPTIQSRIAASLKLDFTSIESIARLAPDPVTLRHNGIEADQKLYWADPDIFAVLRLPVFAGNLQSALQAPDGIVLTRSLARRYFGRDDVLGETLQIDRHYLVRVTAILQDLPPDTHLDLQAIASGRAAFSQLSKLDARARDARMDLVYTYLRLAPGASIADLQQAMPAFLVRRMDGWFVHSLKPSLPLIRFDHVHLTAVTEQSMRPSGDRTTLYAMAAIGLLILVAACTNFVNLMTARAAVRAIEVGARKAVGATRPQLMIQFIGETTLHAALSMITAVCLVELLLPKFNALIGSDIGFHYWREPRLLVPMLAAPLLVGALAGIYPALILSSFSPAAVLKGTTHVLPSSGHLRQLLVTLQFSVLIALAVSSMVIYRQVDYALHDGLRTNSSQAIVIQTPCLGAFPERVRALRGVRGAACAWAPALNLSEVAHWALQLPDGTDESIDGISVDYGFFELFGLRPIAGRFFSVEHSGDKAPEDLIAALKDPAAKPNPTATLLARMVLNETAVRVCGFHSAQDAVGKVLFAGGRPLQIIGVVRDFSFDSVRHNIAPIFYVVLPSSFDVLNVKLDGPQIPQTLEAINGIWHSAGNVKPMTWFFLDEHLRGIYLDIIRRAQLLAVFCAAAIVIACLGLLGMSAFAAERRRAEIGVRKAMGAASADIVRLLLWQFAKPVLWANLIAWPIAFMAMRYWLQGFAYHITLELWPFAVAGALALIVALFTVGTHSILMAHARPVAALRDQ
jgi:putative ABC transport system permease protein